MSETDRYTSHCPICNSLLDIDRETGYSCPQCGWDESFELKEDGVWIIPDDRGDQERSG